MQPVTHENATGNNPARIALVGNTALLIFLSCVAYIFLEFGLSCEYARQRKKRGKASKKDLVTVNATSSGSDRGLNDSASGQIESPNGQATHEVNGSYEPTFDAARTLADSAQPHSRNPGVGRMPNQHSAPVHAQQQAVASSMDGMTMDYTSVPDTNRPPMSVPDLRSMNMMHHSEMAILDLPLQCLQSQGYGSGYNDNTYPLMTSQEANTASMNQFRLGGSGENPSTSFSGILPSSPVTQLAPSSVSISSELPFFQHGPFLQFFTISRTATGSSSYCVYNSSVPCLRSFGCVLHQLLIHTYISLVTNMFVGFVFRKQSFLPPNETKTLQSRSSG